MSILNECVYSPGLFPTGADSARKALGKCKIATLNYTFFHFEQHIYSFVYIFAQFNYCRLLLIGYFSMSSHREMAFKMNYLMILCLETLKLHHFCM